MKTVLLLTKAQLSHWAKISFIVGAAWLFATIETEAQPQCYEKNEFTITMVNCSTIVVTGTSQVVDGQHQWDFGNGWVYNGNIQETYTFPCNGTYSISHMVENNGYICSHVFQVNCGNTLTITENTDPCYSDFPCFKFSTNACPGDQITWDFGDGTVLNCSNCTTVEHCYTNLNTFNGTNTMVTPTVTVNGQTTSTSLNIAAYDMGVFIGRQGAITNLTDFNLVMPGSTYNGATQGNPVYVYGTVHINKTFQFNNADIFVERSGGFTVDTPKQFTIQATDVSSLVGCPCLWRGIDVRSNAVFKGRLNSTLNEALYAVRTSGAAQNPIIGLNRVTLNNNYIGLLANRNFTFEASNGFKGNIFTSTGVLKDWCGGAEDVIDPFGPSGGAYATDRGWAGVYLNNVIGFNVPSTTNAVNTFQNLANGIYMVNSSAPGLVGFSGIWNCSFSNMLRGGYPIAIGGHGIYFLDGVGNRVLTQQGFGMNGTPSFSNCEIGIHAESTGGASGTSVKSHDNNMQQVEFGYRVVGITGSISSTITDNQINCNADFSHVPIISAGVLIDDRFAQSKQHIVDENIIVVDQPTQVFGIGVFIRGSFDVNGTVNSVSVGNNIGNGGVHGITVINGHSCVYVLQYGGVDVHNNTVLAQQNSFANLLGIYFYGGQANSAACNIVDGVDPSLINIPDFVGIHGFGSLGVTIQDNDVMNFDRGIVFSANCGNAPLICNDLLGTQEVGLEYAADAVTGFQFDRGNQWLGTYLDVGARHITPSGTLVLNQFRARQSTTEWPPTIDPISGWFINSNVVPQCPSDPSCETPPGAMMMETPTELDNSIAAENTGVIGGLLWDLEKYLYARLQGNPTAWQGNDLMQGFVAARQHTALGQFHEIGEGIKALYQVSEANQAQLDANMEAVEEKQAAIGGIEVEMANADPDSGEYDALLQEQQQLEAEIIELLQLNADIYAALHDTRVEQAEALLATNSTIPTTEVYEANEQSFFEVYLNTVGKDSKSVSDSQLEILKGIIAQCPSEGGRAVYWANGLYGQLTGELQEVQDCSETGEREQQGTQSIENVEKSSFSISPNPTSGSCTVTCYLPSNTFGEFSVMDIFGRKHSAHPVASGNSKISLERLPAGTYLTVLTTSGKIVQTQTLIFQ